MAVIFVLLSLVTFVVLVLLECFNLAFYCLHLFLAFVVVAVSTVLANLLVLILSHLPVFSISTFVSLAADHLSVLLSSPPFHLPLLPLAQPSITSSVQQLPSSQLSSCLPPHAKLVSHPESYSCLH